MPRVHRETLLSQLESTQPGLASRETIEQSCCFVFRDGRVYTYNDEVSCTIKTGLKITGAVRAEPLLALLRKLPEEEVDVSIGKGYLVVQGKGRKAGILMEPEVQLPIETVDRPTTWKALPEDFCEAVGLVQSCAGRDETHFAMTCVHLHPKHIEAFDNDMQCCRYRIKIGVEKPLLVRRDSIKHVASLGVTSMSVSESWIHFKNAAGLRLSCRIYEDEYKDLSSILQIGGEALTLPKGLVEAVERSEDFSEDNEDENLVSVKLEQNRIIIHGEGTYGWITERKKTKYTGRPLGFMIPPKLLASLARVYSDCLVSEDRVKVTRGKFSWVGCLAVEGDEPETSDPEDQGG